MPGSNPTNNNAVTVSRTVIIDSSTVPVSSQTPSPAAPQQAGPMCVQPQTQYFPANPSAVAQTYQTPAQPGTLGYFMQTMPDVVTAMDLVSAGIDTQTRLNGEGWTRPAVQSDIVSAEISRLRQEAELYDGIPGKERYVETSRYEAGLLEHLSRNGGVPGGNIDIQLAGREVYIVGDLHGNTAGLELILNKADAGGETILQKIQSGKAVVIFEGDAIHPPLEPYDAMDPSIEVLDKIAGLKAQYPDNVFYTRGNHDYVYGSREAMFNKGYVRQGVVFRDVLIRQRTTAFARSAEAFFERAPLTIRVMEGSEVVAGAGHTPVAVDGLTPEQAVAAIFDPAIRTEITWNNPGEGLTTYKRSSRGVGYEYSNAEVVRMRATFGSERTAFVSGHTAYDTSAYIPSDMPGHVILQATSDFNGNLSVVKISPDSSVAIYDVTGTSAMAGVDLRPPIPQTVAVPVAAQPAAAAPAPAQAPAASPASPATAPTPAEAYVDTGTFRLRMSAGDSMPVDVSGEGVTLRCGNESFKLSSYGDVVFVESPGTGQRWSMPQTATRANVNNLFEVTNIGRGQIDVRFAPRSVPVANYSGVPMGDILVFGEPADMRTNTGTFEESGTSVSRPETSRTVGDTRTDPNTGILSSDFIRSGGPSGVLGVMIEALGADIIGDVTGGPLPDTSRTGLGLLTFFGLGFWEYTAAGGADAALYATNFAQSFPMFMAVNAPIAGPTDSVVRDMAEHAGADPDSTAVRTASTAASVVLTTATMGAQVVEGAPTVAASLASDGLLLGALRGSGYGYLIGQTLLTTYNMGRGFQEQGVNYMLPSDYTWVDGDDSAGDIILGTLGGAWQHIEDTARGLGQSYMNTMSRVEQTVAPVVVPVIEAIDRGADMAVEGMDRNLQVLENVVTLDVAQGVYAAVSGDDWCGFWEECFYE